MSLAHGITMIKNIRNPQSLAQLGWIGVLVTMFYLTGMLILEKPLPGFVMPMFYVSFALILLFANFQKNIFKGFLKSLSETPLTVISCFGDIVSYLRLFAVGLAGLTMETTFNSMVIGDGINSVLSGLIAALVLFFAHALNIVLGLLSVVVHGIRLNLLEFSGHMGMQWSGKEYIPFK